LLRSDSRPVSRGGRPNISRNELVMLPSGSAIECLFSGMNVNGSGIGLGHPVGATGNRLMVTLIHAMKKHGKSLGLATLCGGGGVSMATAIEML